MSVVVCWCRKNYRKQIFIPVRKGLWICLPPYFSVRVQPGFFFLGKKDYWRWLRFFCLNVKIRDNVACEVPMRITARSHNMIISAGRSLLLLVLAIFAITVLPTVTFAVTASNPACDIRKRLPDSSCSWFSWLGSRRNGRIFLLGWVLRYREKPGRAWI